MITAAIWCMAVMFYGRYCQTTPQDEVSPYRLLWIVAGALSIPAAAILMTIAVNA